MNIFQRIANWNWSSEPVKQEIQKPSVRNEYFSTGVWSKSYDGEKNLGELGPAIHYMLDHESLRVRSWQSYLESDISQTVLNKYITWVVDRGLKLNSSPSKTILKSEGIALNSEAFNEIVEARFTVWAKSKRSSFSGMMSLQEQAKETMKTAKIGGDALVVLRYEYNNVTVQVIDGAHLKTPYGQALNSRIKNGVELDDRGTHIAYHVKSGNKIERIPAMNNGLRVAFLVYGVRYRLDTHRGMPVIATCLETIKKLERYKEAAVGSAEERQKIVYFIKHGVASDGTNPAQQQIAQALGEDTGVDIPTDDNGEEIANKVQVSTNKQVFNMPLDSELKSLQSTQEMFFKDFYSTNADIICGAVGIPPNVAFSIYNDSFSASRAATKDWDHTIEVERDNFQSQFYQLIYNFWLHMEIITSKVQAPGYITAFMKNNFTVVEAYQTCRFTGPLFPHIDPLKEVKAERAKLGVLGEHLPLTNLELATEALGNSDSDSNMEQFSEELKLANKLGLKIPEKAPVNGQA